MDQKGERMIVGLAIAIALLTVSAAIIGGLTFYYTERAYQQDKLEVTSSNAVLFWFAFILAAVSLGLVSWSAYRADKDCSTYAERQ